MSRVSAHSAKIMSHARKHNNNNNGSLYSLSNYMYLPIHSTSIFPNRLRSSTLECAILINSEPARHFCLALGWYSFTTLRSTPGVKHQVPCTCRAKKTKTEESENGPNSLARRWWQKEQSSLPLWSRKWPGADPWGMAWGPAGDWMPVNVMGFSLWCSYQRCSVMGWSCWGQHHCNGLGDCFGA